MKKSFVKILTVIGLFACTVSSASAMGLFYTDASYPVTATGVTSPTDLSKLKSGTSKATNILWVVELGDAGIDAAAKSGGIKKINYIDINEKTIFIFYRKITTTVYGE